jgi:hypothetical protein
MSGKDKHTLVEGLPFDDEDGLPFDLDEEAPTRQSSTAKDDDWASEWEEDDITNVGAVGPAAPVATTLDASAIDPTPGTLNAYLMHLVEGGDDIAHIIAPDVVMVHIGRGRKNEIQVASDGEISRRHCLIMRQRDTFFIEDLGSTNGTVVDGEPVALLRLEPDALIKLGETLFRFVFMPQSSVATARTITSS